MGYALDSQSPKIWYPGSGGLFAHTGRVGERIAFRFQIQPRRPATRRNEPLPSAPRPPPDDSPRAQTAAVADHKICSGRELNAYPISEIVVRTTSGKESQRVTPIARSSNHITRRGVLTGISDLDSGSPSRRHRLPPTTAATAIARTFVIASRYLPILLSEEAFLLSKTSRCLDATSLGDRPTDWCLESDPVIAATCLLDEA